MADYLTIRWWKNLHAFQKYFLDKAASIPTSSRYYTTVQHHLQNEYAQNLLRGSGEDEKQRWLGRVYPKTVQDGMSRLEFEDMARYDEVEQELTEYIKELLKKSIAVLPEPKMAYNDRELGAFSLERALMMPQPMFLFWSKTHEKFFFPNEVEVSGDKIYLKSDKTEVELQEAVDEFGRKKITSLNKKSFIYKEKKNKPINAIHLIVSPDVPAGRPTVWIGTTATIIARYMESMGYKVRITAMYGTRYGGERGVRYIGYEAKNYDETLDIRTALYGLADESFYRLKIFPFFAVEEYEFGIQSTDNWGTINVQQFERDLTEASKRGDFDIAEDALDYYIGGNNCVTPEQAKEQIAKAICCAELRNQKTVSKIKNIPYLLPDDDELRRLCPHLYQEQAEELLQQNQP